MDEAFGVICVIEEYRVSKEGGKGIVLHLKSFVERVLDESPLKKEEIGLN